MGYWDGVDREEARRVRALPWPRRVVEHAAPWAPLVIILAGLAIALWRR